jgi:FMN phosphatase YigB (HAD superfamily)
MKLHDHAALASLPKLVIFDLDNTLYAYGPAHEAGMAALVAKAQNRLGPSGQRFLDAFADARDTLKTDLGLCAAAHDRLLYMHRTLEALGLKSQPLLALDFEQTYWRAFLNASVLRPGARELLDTLRSLGIDRVLVTDLTTRIQFRKLAYHGLDEAFEYIVTSEEAGADKPSERVWTLLSRKLGTVEPPVWSIGDDIAKDLAGPAEHFGAAGIHVAKHQVKHGFAATCSSFEGLVDHIRALAATG